MLFNEGAYLTSKTKGPQLILVWLWNLARIHSWN